MGESEVLIAALKPIWIVVLAAYQGVLLILLDGLLRQCVFVRE